MTLQFQTPFKDDIRKLYLQNLSSKCHERL